MSRDQYKIIYKNHEAMVDESVINLPDDEIDAALSNSALGEPDIGMVIYTADMSIIKRKGLNGAWIPMSILH